MIEILKDNKNIYNDIITIITYNKFNKNIIDNIINNIYNILINYEDINSAEIILLYNEYSIYDYTILFSYIQYGNKIINYDVKNIVKKVRSYNYEEKIFIHILYKSYKELINFVNQYLLYFDNKTCNINNNCLIICIKPKMTSLYINRYNVINIDIVIYKLIHDDRFRLNIIYYLNDCRTEWDKIINNEILFECKCEYYDIIHYYIPINKLIVRQ